VLDGLAGSQSRHQLLAVLGDVGAAERLSVPALLNGLGASGKEDLIKTLYGLDTGQKDLGVNRGVYRP
jgi:hypothetical protein